MFAFRRHDDVTKAPRAWHDDGVQVVSSIVAAATSGAEVGLVAHSQS